MPPLTEKQKAYQREYYLKNREKKLAYLRRWRQENPEKVNASTPAYKKKHKDRLDTLRLARERTPERKARRREKYQERKLQRTPEQQAQRGATAKRWRLDNLDKVRETKRLSEATRHARKRGSGGTCSSAQWHSRCSMFLWRCAYCGTTVNSSSVTIDHVLAISRGGTNWPSNLVPACKPCNMKKHTDLWLPKVYKIERKLPR